MGHALTVIDLQAILSQFSHKRAAKGETSADVKQATKALAKELSDTEPNDDDIATSKDFEKSCKDANEKVLNSLEEENPDLILTCKELAQGQHALEKVRPRLYICVLKPF